MKTIDLILLLIIIFIFLLMYRYRNIISFSNNRNIDDIKEQFDDGCLDNSDDNYYIDELVKDTKEDIDRKINHVFVEAQYHDDYRDTITAFNNVAPSQKQIFNQGNMPIEFTNPDPNDVKKLIKDFIRAVNKNLSQIPEYRISTTGWDEPLADPGLRVKSGWKKHMEGLGLPSSLYPDPAKKAKIILLAVDHIEKYETEDEVKYVCYLFLKKTNTKVQLVIKVSYVMSKRDINADRNFFDKEFKPDETNVIIEEIFILGYLTIDGINKYGSAPDQFYNFNGLDKQEILDGKTIIKELRQKYRQRAKDMNNFTSSLDNEDKVAHMGVPSMANYKSYLNTYTINEDLLNKNKTYS